MPPNWLEETEFKDISQLTYYRYYGTHHYNNPNINIIEIIEILIYTNSPGTFQYRWPNLIAEGTPNTKANDSWLKIITDDYYGLKGIDYIVCPKGFDHSSNDCPIELNGDGNTMPEGSGINGWLKVYRSVSGLWKRSTRTSDNDPHEIYARFDAPGIYMIQISGRSKNHALDCFG